MANTFTEDRSAFFHEFNSVYTVTPEGFTPGCPTDYTINCIEDLDEREISSVIISVQMILFDDIAYPLLKAGDMVKGPATDLQLVTDVISDGTGIAEAELEFI